MRDKALGKAPATSPNPPVLEYGATSDEARITRIVCYGFLAFLCVSSYRGNGRAILKARSKPCQATLLAWVSVEFLRRGGDYPGYASLPACSLGWKTRLANLRCRIEQKSERVRYHLPIRPLQMGCLQMEE